MIAKESLISSQKVLGRLFSSVEEKIFSNETWNLLGTDINLMAKHIDGLTIVGTNIFDRYAKSVLMWYTAEEDAKLPFHKRSKWALG